MQDAPPHSPLTEAVIAEFRDVVGAEHALTDPQTQTPYLTEWRGLYTGVSPLVLRPGSVDEVSAILRIANAHRVPVVPQAGNTGLVGGQTPHATNSEIVVTIERLRRVRNVDPDGNTMTVDAGLTLAECQAAAEAADRLFPLSLPSEGSCRIGGNIATNAGGVGVLAYGNTRQLVMGIEAVLPDGRVLNDLNTLKKNNTGFDLKNLFIGSEGTLGIVTGAVLKLFPLPAEKATAMVTLERLETAIELLAHMQKRAGAAVTAFEFIPRNVAEMVFDHIPGARDPFDAPHPWYVLTEFSGMKADGTTAELMETVLMEASEQGLLRDAVIAGSVQQAKELWTIREGISEAQKHVGAGIKHDISVPVSKIPEFLETATARILELCPNARPIPLGHFGDGNVHYNIAQPIGMDPDEFLKFSKPFSQITYEVVGTLGGSISAEHGIGRIKREALRQSKDPVALDLMRGIKDLIDPNGIMNPGKVL